MEKENNRPVVIFDIDGVLADNTIWQQFEGEADYNLFVRLCPDMQANGHMVWLAKVFYELGYEVHVLTSRNEKLKPQTEAWLNKYDLGFVLLHMRPSENKMSAAELKEVMLECITLKGRDICAAFDDETDCVAMYARRNIPVLNISEFILQAG